MQNPFEVLIARLGTIEDLLLEIKHGTSDRAGLVPKEEIYTIQEAAEFLGLTINTLYRKVSKREIPSMKRGNRLYFSNKELVEYLKGGKKLSNKEVSEEADKYIQKKG